MTDHARRGLRVDQLLSRFGYGSRREAAAWLRDGRVTVEGVPRRDPADRVDPRAVRIDGEPVEAPDGLLAMFHKPAGVVCSRDEREGPTIYDRLPARWSRRNPPVTSVGRLDRDTTGLLLVTDLGELVHRWTSPRQHVEKTYEVTVRGRLDPSWVERLGAGELWLEGDRKPCLPARLEILSPTEARLHLVEGRYHQVRRMFAALGVEVIRLHRSRFGPYELGDLVCGDWAVLAIPSSCPG